ncbi:MAG: endopeptidase La [Gemmatimonadetes bacterium]|nr:endopeptidase La [Gemmatimonadota bacterium]MYD13434.1 endopeptidase La [Gemmatimonadota bacterium]
MATLHRVDGSFEIPAELPVIALRDIVFFPYMVLPLLIGRPPSVAALTDARAGDRLALLVAQRDPGVDQPERADLYRVGTLVRVVQVTQLKGRTARAVLEGLGRARIDRFLPDEPPLRASVTLVTGREHETDPAPDPGLDALVRSAEELFREYVQLCDKIPDDLVATLSEATDRVRLAHLMAGHLLVASPEKQEILEAEDSVVRFELLLALLMREVDVLRIQQKLDEQMRLQMEIGEGPRPLEEQLDVLQPESRALDPEWVELEIAIEEADLPGEVRDRVEREFGRLRKLNPVAPEASVIRTYLDWLLALPWKHETTDSLDADHAAEVLDAEHYGLEEVKERILDHIAVLSLVGKLQGPILCLVGPPGVGKTSLGRSIAGCLERSFVRVSLGGVGDEAEIRGHRRTYVGALPGRVVQGMRRGGSRNPVFLLDEIDKLARDFHGDPAAALLEVLDPEQNRTFTDHYLELEFDLSDVLFIATANTLGEIPEPLRDRMEVIRLPGYLDTEKLVIARRFLWPRQVARHGLEPFVPSISDGAIRRIIAEYTREAGVRELERRLSRVARKLARQVAGRGERGADEDGREPVERVEAAGLAGLLGPPVHLPHRREDGRDRAGIACGLAWTAAGGEVLEVEVAVVPGSGKIQLTGTLGEVMKESAFAAVTYARSRARWLGLSEQFHQEVDIHIHIPEGATPKDGPSAGITIAVALISALTNTPTRADLAMTGEITLRGRVLVVGGIKEKAVAALRGGIKRMLLPGANVVDIERLPDEVRTGVKLVPVESMDQVLREALVARRRASSRADAVAQGAHGLGGQVT